jgi:hypothetical protein
VWEFSGTLKIKIARTGDIWIQQSVNYATSSGSATAGSDFVTASGTFTFAAGEIEKEVSISLINDGLVEPDETFEIKLSNPSGNSVLGQNNKVIVTVKSDDLAPAGEIGFAETNSIFERSVGTAAVKVHRTGAANLEVTVEYATVAGTASEGSDYLAASGTLTFASGEIEKEISVSILPNGSSEAEESFQVILSNPTGGVELGLASHTLTITHNATPPDPVERVALAKGGFHGLATGTQELGLGGLGLKIAAREALTGTLQIAGHTYRFKGKVDAQGQFTKVFTVRIGRLLVSRTLHLQFDAEGKALEGTFELESGNVYALTAARDAVGTRKNPVPNVARYNVLLSGEEPLPLRGYLVADVRSDGCVSVTGSLPDGTALKATAHVSEEGGIAIFIPRYPKRLGYLAGNLQITPGDSFPLKGTLEWRKPVVLQRLPVEFDDIALEAAGAPYFPATARQRRDAFYGPAPDGGQVRISSVLFGEIEFTFTRWVNNKAVFAAEDNDVRLSFQPKTGLFTGSYRHTDGQRYPFTGIYVPQVASGPDSAEGFLKGTVGIVELLPASN